MLVSFLFYFIFIYISDILIRIIKFINYKIKAVLLLLFHSLKLKEKKKIFDINVIYKFDELNRKIESIYDKKKYTEKF